MNDDLSIRTGIRLSQISPSRQQLVRLLQNVHFGKVLNVQVRNGEPVLSPPPKITRTLKFCGRNEPRPQAIAKDFALKQEVIELLEQIARLRHGTIQSISVAYGLPQSAEVQESPVP